MSVFMESQISEVARIVVGGRSRTGRGFAFRFEHCERLERGWGSRSPTIGS